MKWRKLGVVWNTDGSRWWSRSHAMGPIPVLLDDERIRLFLTTLDEKGRGRPTYVDLSARDPMQVLGVADHPLMDIGAPGTFDDNGLMGCSIVQDPDGRLHMYYVGFELCTQIRYRLFTSVATSSDGGETFVRRQLTPVLDRSSDELFFRCGPFAMVDDGIVKLWYIAGSSWTSINGKDMPVYDLRYQESRDGLQWAGRGTLSLELSHEDEHGFGRPWIVKHGTDDYRMFYSIRRRSFGAYRLGYAESSDGIRWTRKDAEMGLDVTAGGFDSDAMMYSAVLQVHGRTFCFYNGNGFGQTGVGVAELLID